MDTPANSLVRFGVFELDARAGELRRSGYRVALQPQPLEILRALIERPGEVVTREELRSRLWGNGAYVDFDRSLNKAIVKLRDALGDDADSPRYIETLPRHGYRFIPLPQVHVHIDAAPREVSAPKEHFSIAPEPAVPVSTASAASAGPAPSSGHEPAARDETTSSIATTTAPGRRPRLQAQALIAALAAAALLTGAYALWRARSGASLTRVRVEAPAQGGLPARSVAVLPFENLSTERSDGFLATGIAASVLHRLAGVKSLSVIARTSSFTFRGRDADARDIGRRLNARYLVEGSVQRAGDRLRVTAQLLDANSGSDVWSLRFERHMGDIFELEDEISGKVTDALAVSLEASPASSTARGTPKLDAYLAYIEGRSLLSTFKVADAEAGIARLRRATEIDPTFAAAYAEEAHGLRLLAWLPNPVQPGTETESQAAALVDKALSLDPELGEAWVERAYGRQQRSPGFDAATDADFRKGLALAPNYAQGYHLYGEWLAGIGRTDDALAMIERARQLDPLTARSHYLKGVILLEKGDEHQAVALFLEALRVNPTYPAALTRLGEVEASHGNFADAAKFMERAIALDPRAEWVRQFAAGVYLNLSDVAAAQDALATVPPRVWRTAPILEYLGESQRAAAEVYALQRSELITELRDEPWDSAVIRDDALQRRDYGPALRALAVCLTQDWDSALADPVGFPGFARTICAVRYASVLMVAGERERATKLLQGLLKVMERHEPYSSGWQAEARALACALLGDTDGALKALEVSFAAEKWLWWWYDFERAPELQGLHSQPRFQDLARQYHDIVAKQSTLVAAMRRAGEVPYRPPSQAATAKN